MFIGPGRGIFYIIREDPASRNPLPAALTEYGIKEMSPQFQELWMIPDVYIVADFTWKCDLLTFDSKLFFKASFEQNEPMSLNRAHLETGEIAWQVTPEIESSNVMTHNYVFDVHTGRPQTNVVGDVAEDGGHVFYLTTGAQLQAVNAKTGQTVATVQFTPSLQELDGSERVNREFCVAASDGIVVVYFGSGRQLFAFRFLPDE